MTATPARNICKVLFRTKVSLAKPHVACGEGVLRDRSGEASINSDISELLSARQEWHAVLDDVLEGTHEDLEAIMITARSAAICVRVLLHHCITADQSCWQICQLCRGLCIMHVVKDILHETRCALATSCHTRNLCSNRFHSVDVAQTVLIGRHKKWVCTSQKQVFEDKRSKQATHDCQWRQDCLRNSIWLYCA